MSPDRFEGTCPRCEQIFEYGYFTRSLPYCPDCKEAVDAEQLRAIGEGKVTWVEDRLGGISSGKSEMDRQADYTREDHRINVDRRK